MIKCPGAPGFCLDDVLCDGGRKCVALMKKEAKVRRWEYLIADDHGSMREQPAIEMNRLGEEGWELVAVRNTSVDVPEYVFKREIAEAAPHINQKGSSR